MNIYKLNTLPAMNDGIAKLERALRANEENTPEDLVLGRELLRKLKERRRIFIYRRKSFTPNGHTVRL